MLNDPLEDSRTTDTAPQYLQLLKVSKFISTTKPDVEKPAHIAFGSVDTKNKSMFRLSASSSRLLVARHNVHRAAVASFSLHLFAHPRAVLKGVHFQEKHRQ